MKKINFLKLIASLIIAQAAGLLGSLATMPNIAGWYADLIKPGFNPPNWIFGPVWTILFLMMGAALYLVWINDCGKKQIAYLFFSLQLVFNVIWSWLFFGLQNPLAAAIEIVFLWILILGNLIYFYKINKAAGWLLVPYLFWVAFAAVLNYYIVILN